MGALGLQREVVHPLVDQNVRYTIQKRAGSDVYFVFFKGPNGRRERSTGVTKKADVLNEARRIILDEFQQTDPTEVVTWDAAKQKLAEALAADGKREKTRKGYSETLGKFIAMFPVTRGPADVTERMAADFKVKYAATKFTRKRNVAVGETATEYQRKPRSLDSRIRTLKATFNWFKSLGLVRANPFENVTGPDLDRHEVKYVKQGDVSEFYEWLEERFPGWEMPKLFFTVKALTACRLDDLCHLRSSQLQDGRLVFTADQTKNRSERYAPLPEDVYAALKAYAGTTHLWEKYPPELIAVNKKKHYPTHRQNLEFAPRRLYSWVVQIMQAYQKATGKALSSHDFRRAAFTRAAEKDVHPKRAAVAFDVTAETMLRYYTATEKKKTADEVLGTLANDLRPKKKPTE